MCGRILWKGITVKFAHTFVLVLGTCTAMIPLTAVHQAKAQTLANSSDASAPNIWDAAAVTTVSGSIKSIVPQHTSGAPGGSVVLIDSSQGELYANFGTRLDSRLEQQLAIGRFATLTGITRDQGGNKYILVQRINLNGQTFVIRNAHGLPMKNISTAQATDRVRQGSFGGVR
jgi:hypothetical protein